MPFPLEAAALTFDQPAGDLASSLRQLAAKAGANLLFDSRVTLGLRAHRVSRAKTLDEALGQMLTGTALMPRHQDGGGILILAAPVVAEPIADRAYPEILVVGKRSSNVDIPRSADDIQPYRVVSDREIADSGEQTLDGFLKDRLTDNAQALSAIQASVLNNASAASQLDLRGLGAANTLVLVDGHRLPSFPAAQDFGQSNINGIPIDAIDRVETLSSTAGGIYGPGATGGVVNIILKHDPTDNGVSVSRGISGRGDDPTWRVHAHLGFRSHDDQTQLSFDYEHVSDAGLEFGDRSEVGAAQTRRLTADTPQQFIPPVSGAINIVSPFGTNLILAPAYGGQTLSSDHTWIPLSAVGAPDMVQLMIANAGTYDTQLSPDGNGTRQSLLTATKTDGFVFSLRQELSPSVEARLDVLGYRALGLATGSLLTETRYGTPFALPGQPFIDFVQYTYPASDQIGHLRNETRTLRATGALLVKLPLGWKADADFSYGYSDLHARYPSGATVYPYEEQFPDIFADPAGFAKALAAWSSPYTKQRSSDRLLDANIRLAGPLFELPGGTASMTLTEEVRAEYNPGTDYDVSDPDQRYRAPHDLPGQSQQVQSVYAEMRLPLVPLTTPIAPLRGLEIQLTGRGDRVRVALPVEIADIRVDEDDTRLTTLRALHHTFSFTAGARMHPLPWLTLRSSYATGYLPPSAADMVPQEFLFGDIGQPDPKRGNADIGSEVPVLYNAGGSPNLKSEYAHSFSAGTIIKSGGFRLSVDYTRLVQSRQIVQIPDSALDFAALEAAIPDVVVRAPLTDADKAAGYTGGVITEYDPALHNIGRSVLQTVDADFSYTLPVGSGRLAFSGRGTWTPSYRRRDASFAPYYNLAGHIDGPIELKANIGLDWRSGPFSAGVNVQILGKYDLTYGDLNIGHYIRDDLYRVIEQGTDHIPAQAYVDLCLGYRAGNNRPGPVIQYRFIVQNLMNKKPPIYVPALDTDIDTVTTTGIGYSYYGDIVGRRFQLSVGVQF